MEVWCLQAEDKALTSNINKVVRREIVANAPVETAAEAT